MTYINNDMRRLDFQIDACHFRHMLPVSFITDHFVGLRGELHLFFLHLVRTLPRRLHLSKVALQICLGHVVRISIVLLQETRL